MFNGSDTDQMRTAGGQLLSAADSLDQMLSGLVTSADGLTWSGPDGDAFRQGMASFSPVWQRLLVGSLRAEGSCLRLRADLQDAVSAALDAAGSAPGSIGSSPIGGGGAGGAGGPSIAALVSQIGQLGGWATSFLSNKNDLVQHIAGLSPLDSLGWASLGLGTASLGLGILEQVLPGRWGLGAGALSQVTNIGGTVAGVMPILSGGPVGMMPGFAIVGGAMGMVQNGADFIDNPDWGSGLSFGGSALTTAGGVAMLIPGGQVIGGGLLIAGATVQGVGWAVDHADEIGDFVNDTGSAISGAGHSVGNAIGSGFHKLGGLF